MEGIGGSSWRIGRIGIGAALAALLLATIGCPTQTPTPGGTTGRGGTSKPPGSVSPPLVTREGVPVIRVLLAVAPNHRIGATGSWRILIDGKEAMHGDGPLNETGLSWSEGAFHAGVGSFAGAEMVLEAGTQGVQVGKSVYRGSLHFTTDGAAITAINHVDAENYLAGVIGRELYPNWQAATYEAQAIAARTYALYERATFGQDHAYDVRDDQGSQVYGGASAETDKSRQAVQRTRGTVLTAGPAGQEKVFKAYFSSCCGGVTNSSYVLNGGPVSGGPLAGGVVCNDCKACPKFRWPPVTIAKAVIYPALVKTYPSLAALGSLKAVEVTEGTANRPIWLQLVSNDNKTARLRANDLRLAMLRDGVAAAKGLFSMNCRLRDAGTAIVFDEGQGFGHGVGLCQFGAEGMALRGVKAREILSTYYPTAKFIKAYE